MKEIKLEALSREAGKSARRWLQDDKIPAVIYGRGVQSRSIAVPARAFKKVYNEVGESSLLDLSLDGGAAVKVLIQEVQVDPLRDSFIHVDFLQVKMDEKLKTEIPFEFVGESAAIKALGGTLVKNRSAIEVECLPADLVPEIPVDIGALKTFEDTIRVKDIVLSKGITVLTELNEVVALVAPHRTDEEMKTLESKVEASVESVQVVEKKKAEGEEAAKPAVE